MLAEFLSNVQKERMEHLKRKQVQFDGKHQYREFKDLSARI